MATATALKITIIAPTIAQGVPVFPGDVLELDAGEANTLLRLRKAEPYTPKARAEKAVATGGEKTVTN